MRRIDRYLLAEMTVPALVGVMLLLLLLVGNTLYTLLQMLYGGASVRDLGMILLYSIPLLLLQAIPGALLLATALSLNRLERDRELLAIRMAGVRLKRAILPYLLLGIFGAVGIFVMQETFVPHATHKAALLTRKILMNSPLAFIQQDVFFKTDNYVFYVGEVDAKNQVLKQVLVYKKELSSLTLLIIPWAENRNGRWFFRANPITKEPPLIYTFSPNGKGDFDISRYGPMESGYLDIKEDVWKFITDEPSSPEELTFVQLLHLLKGMRGVGNSVSGYSLPLTPPQLTFFLHRKLAIALSALVAILIAIPLSVHYGRSGGYVGLLLSVVVAFFFTISQQWAGILIKNNILDPALAAWAPDALFGAIGIILLILEE